MYSLKGTSLFLLAQAVASSPVGQLQERACPGIHVFGARETTVSPGYGSAGTVVNLILNSHSGSTSEAINYPACGGQSSCGSVSYANSVIQGINGVVSQVNSFNAQCPSTQLVLVGYSQVSKPLWFFYISSISRTLGGRNSMKLMSIRRVAKYLTTHFAEVEIRMRAILTLLFLSPHRR
jgi:hypothetical protein